MEEDDMIVFVVVDDKDAQVEEIDERVFSSVSEEIPKMEDNKDTVEKYEESLDIEIKVESVSSDEYECTYLEDEKTEVTDDEDCPNPQNKYADLQKTASTLLKNIRGGLTEPLQEFHIQSSIKDEPENYDDFDDNNLSFHNYFSDKKAIFDSIKDLHGEWVSLSKDQRRSFVEELRKSCKDLKDDEELLIDVLEQIMRNTKSPELPQDYYVMKGGKYKCIHCDKAMETKQGAGRHYRERHGPRYLMCFACGRDFRSTANLYKHEKRCVSRDAFLVLLARAASLGPAARSRPGRVPRLPAPKFPCEECSAVFTTKNNLRSHQNLHRGERPYRCHVCPCAYTSYSALYRHTQKHTDAHFLCEHCSRSFKLKAALVAHMDTHLALRKHACLECNRRFAQKAALVLHVNKVHRNLPPPCACQICPKRYPRMSLLKAHMKKEHGMSIITRKMFLKSLPGMTNMEVRPSKVIFKKDDDSYHNHISEGLKKEEDQNVGEDNAKENQDAEYIIPDYGFPYIDDEGSSPVEDIMQYMVKSENKLDGNVVYIENGEVVQMTRR